jgi:glutamyl-tRNA reductase
VRERIAVPAERVTEILAAVSAEGWAQETMLLSTCNRTEAYAVSAAGDAASLLVASLRRLLPSAPPEEEGVYVRRVGEDAAVHLFRVAAGLESAMLGETEIQGQVKEAHRLGREATTVGAFLDRLATSALHAGKRVRTETAISRGAVSHGQAAYEVARRIFGDLKHRSVLVVGAGEMATRAALALAALPGGAYVVANRTRERAERLLAALGGGEAADLEAVEERLARAHVAVFAGGPGTMPAERVRAATAKRRDPLLILDYGVPRRVEPAAADIQGVFLYDLEAVEALMARALDARRSAVSPAEAILEEEVHRFRSWHKTLRAVPVLRSLAAWAEEVRRAEVAMLPPDCPPATRAAVEETTKRLVERLVRRPAARVRRGVEQDDPALPTPDHLRNLFGLGEDAGGAPKRAGSGREGDA